MLLLETLQYLPGEKTYSLEVRQLSPHPVVYVVYHIYM